MSGPRIGALFAGYGGLDMAVSEVFGGEMAWYSEIDKGALKILSHRFPEVPNVGSVTKIDWSTVEPVDILTGGSPCQDLSHAGRRAGMTEGTRSNLWVAMREAIAQLRPTTVIWENVRGAYSAEADSALEFCAGCMGDAWYRGAALRALGRVLGDLSDLGYDCRWHGLRAADIGAPHGRFRVFVVATDTRDGAGHGEWARSESRQGGEAHSGMGGDPSGASPILLPSPRTSDTNGAGAHGDGGLDLRTAVSLLPQQERNSLPLNAVRQWGDYADAIARWEHTLGRPAPAPTMTSTKGNPQLSPAFVEWMMGLPAGWVTDVPGITRNEALKALGNGVVPQQATAALRTMLAWEVAA